MASKEVVETDDLPGDNAARIAIFDALSEAFDADDPHPTLSENELAARVIGRLRILVPRELYLHGEQAYVREKLDACITAGIVEVAAGTTPRRVSLTGMPPQIRYPDGTIREYKAGLEAARERLEAADAQLRQRKLDLNKLVPSLADDTESDDFQALVASMGEHGYLKQFPIVEGTDGTVVDGRARLAAADIAGVAVARMNSKERLPPRRDTPLHRALLMLDLNRARLSDEDRLRAHEAIARQVGREWSAIAADLALTREWRRAKRRYTAKFQVKTVKFRSGDAARVQITTDGNKVALRSLLQAAGLANYKDRTLLEYVHGEHAQSSARPGPPSIFVRVADAIDGIGVLQMERHKVEPEWEAIRQWLIRNTPAGRAHAQGTVAKPTSGSAIDAVSASQEALQDSEIETETPVP